MNKPEELKGRIEGSFDANTSTDDAIRQRVMLALEQLTAEHQRQESVGECRSIRAFARIQFKGGVGGLFVLDMRLLPTNEIEGDELVALVNEAVSYPTPSEPPTFEPKTYFDNGRTVEWGADLSEETKAALAAGEVFTLLDTEGTPHSRLLHDSYGTLREGPIVDPTGISASMFGVPPSPFTPCHWPACQIVGAHVHCPECGSVEHDAAHCETMG